MQMMSSTTSFVHLRAFMDHRSSIKSARYAGLKVPGRARDPGGRIRDSRKPEAERPPL